MAKAHWDNAEVIEALRSKEPGVAQPQPALDLLAQAKKLQRWEIEMLVDALQDYLEN